MPRNDWSKLKARLARTDFRRGKLLVGLDFDGVLSEITPHPADAALSPRTAQLLKALRGRSDTRLAIISGRGIGDLRRLVGLHGIFYSGNHGLQIRGPGLRWMHPEANEVDRAVWRGLEEGLKDIPGAIVEHKILGAAIHYRQVRPEHRRRLSGLVRAHHRSLSGRFRILPGKKIFDLRPALAWDKGRALDMIRQRLEPRFAWNAVFVGDDKTDEEAFLTLAGTALTVRVGRVSRSAAQYVIPGRSWVDHLLEELVRRPGAS